MKWDHVPCCQHPFLWGTPFLLPFLEFWLSDIVLCMPGCKKGHAIPTCPITLHHCPLYSNGSKRRAQSYQRPFMICYWTYKKRWNALMIPISKGFRATFHECLATEFWKIDMWISFISCCFLNFLLRSKLFITNFLGIISLDN